MKTVILAGGLGSRLAEETTLKPKPMVEIGGKPIVWHLMSIYASFGFQEFVLALGHMGEIIKDYFLRFHGLHGDVTVNLGDGTHVLHGRRQPDWRVHLCDTGADTQTGGRLKRLRPLIDQETFMVTYADGLARIDLRALLEFHKRHGKLATVTAVHPPSRFGQMAIDGDTVRSFAEKPEALDGWINGGFFVFEPGVLNYVAGDATVLEREPLESLAAAGQLMAYRHEGFWQMMDTIQERRLLEELWKSGGAPWKVWP
jgi:glucose-1-phosphate cytidylyltransferase